MNKKLNDEVDLSLVWETIWNGKWKIITITMIFFIISIVYTSNTPNLFKASTTIQKSNLNLKYKYKYINKIIEETMSADQEIIIGNYITTIPDKQTQNIHIDSSYIFGLFIKEFKDYNEMISVLSKNKYVKDKIKNLNDTDKRLQLVKFAKNFIFVKPKNKDNLWKISFHWHSVDEGISLFNSALNLTLVNVKKTLLEDINNLATSIDLENKRKIASLKSKLQSIRKLNQLFNAKRTLYLAEQSNIAKEVGIEKNEITAIANLGLTPQNPIKQKSNRSNYSLKNFNELENYPYFLRGYKAIDKEIELIKKRSFQENDLMSEGYINIMDQLTFIEDNNKSVELKNALKTIKKDNISKWIKFNLELAEIDDQKKSYRYIIFSIILGFIFGLIYLALSYIYVSKMKHIKV